MIRTKRKMKRNNHSELQEWDIMNWGVYKGFAMGDIHPIYFLRMLRDGCLPEKIRKYAQKRKYQFKKEVQEENRNHLSKLNYGK